jgi:hypothetical protein
MVTFSTELIITYSRFEKYTPGLETPFRFELQNIPGEWLTVNASSEVHLQHDSQFPQSLVAAMNCLIHCKFIYYSGYFVLLPVYSSAQVFIEIFFFRAPGCAK